MPSWGAPAKEANISSSKDLQSPLCHPSPDAHSNTYSRGHNRNTNRIQRHNPYPRYSHGQDNQDVHSSGGLLPSPVQTQTVGDVSNFSSDNPFMSQTQFSEDNPFQNTDTLRGSENPYRHTSSPVNRGSPRPPFQPSPFIRTPRGCGPQPRFSPRTPSNFYTPPTQAFSPSPRYHTPPNRFQGGFPRGSGFAKRGFGNRNDSFGNPGGSDDIQKYVNPSMLEDPWRNLPATPFMQTY